VIEAQTTDDRPKIGFDSSEMMLRAITNMLNTGSNAAASAALLDVLADAPDNPPATALLGTVYERAGDLERALPLFDRAVGLDPSDLSLHSARIFAYDQCPKATLEECYRIRRRVNDLLRVDQIIPHSNDRDPERKIRVGYVSNDFKNHSAAFGFSPVLILHDATQFELYAYSGTPGTDWVTETLQAAVPNWRNAAYWPDDQLEAQIRADQIDILVDLSGHSAGNRLRVFARKPAPVQITAWGYITGTGLDAVDYIFADDVTITPDEEHFYAEEVVRLPRILTYWAADPAAVGAVPPLPAETNGYLTLGYFGRLGKIQPDVAAAWMAILGRLPDARLILKCPGLDDEAARAGLERMLLEAGGDLDRIAFRGLSSKNDHLISHYACDLALDPSPHGGGMTTLEACWMGLPVLTMPHTQIVSRIATTVNRELGLSYLIADSWDDYVERAVALNDQLPELARVRRLLREMMKVSAFGDHGSYARAVESQYRDVWRRWCSGEALSQRVTPHIVPLTSGNRLWDADANQWVSA
jgi:protein O-GlcNAc transferase